MDNRVLNTITQYDSLILSMKLYYSHTLSEYSYSPKNSTVSPFAILVIRGARSILCATNTVCPLFSFKINF